MDMDFREIILREIEAGPDGQPFTEEELTKNAIILTILLEDIREKVHQVLYQHIWHVQRLCGIFADACNFPFDAKQIFLSIAIAHDLGKSAFPDLLGKYPLLDKEKEQYKEHVAESLELVRPLAGRSGELIRLCVSQHHERPHGNGYPNGLHGDQLSSISIMFINLDVMATILWPAPQSPRSRLHPKARFDFFLSELQKGSQDGEFGRAACNLLVQMINEGVFDALSIDFEGESYPIENLRRVATPVPSGVSSAT